MEPGNSTTAGNTPLRAPWRLVFPQPAGLHVSRGGAVKVVPKIEDHADNDPFLQPFSTYTALPEQILAFESETMNRFLAALTLLGRDMSAYAAQLDPAVPEWQSQVDALTAAVTDVSNKAFDLNIAIDNRLRATGTLGGSTGDSSSSNDVVKQA